MLSVTVPELVLNPNQSINQFDDNDNTSVNNKIAVEKLRKGGYEEIYTQILVRGRCRSRFLRMIRQMMQEESTIINYTL